MKKIATIVFALVSILSFGQGITTKCATCPPTLSGVPDGYVLTDSSGLPRWQAPAGGSIDTNRFWNISGNSGTTAGTNFIGTTDSKGLYFKTKNTTAIVVDTNQNVGIGTASPDKKLSVVSSFNVLDPFANEIFYATDDAPFGLKVGMGDVGSAYNSTRFNVDDALKVISAEDSVFHNNGKFKLTDGTQSAGNVLTSDANGNASWQVPQYVTDTSSIASLNLSVTKNYYSFFGTTATWTLPAVSGNTGKSFLIKNRGSGSITLNSNGGGNDIYNTSATNSLTITAGSSYILVNDGTYWTVN